MRDLLVVAVVAAAAAYVLTRFNYSSFPRLPRLAGATAALLGIGEAVAGVGLRRRIQQNYGRDRQGEGPRQRMPQGLPGLPVPPLVAARALQVAKASALAGAALTGVWVGFALYVIPHASQAVVMGADTVTAIVGAACAVVLLAGALWLEYCCRTPDDDAPPGAA